MLLTANLAEKLRFALEIDFCGMCHDGDFALGQESNSLPVDKPVRLEDATKFLLRA